MKKLVYGLLITVTLFLGIQGVKAEDGKLTCVYEYTYTPLNTTHTYTVEIIPGQPLTESYHYTSYPGDGQPGGKVDNARAALSACLTSSKQSLCTSKIEISQFTSKDGYKCPTNFYYHSYYVAAGNVTYYTYGFDNQYANQPGTNLEFKLNQDKSSNTISNKESFSTCNFRLGDEMRSVTIASYKSGRFETIITDLSRWTSQSKLDMSVNLSDSGYKASCSDYKTLYTNCGNAKKTDMTSCEITDIQKDGYEELSTKEYQKNYDSSDFGNLANGKQYKEYLEQLRVPLGLSNNFNKISNFSFSTYDGTTTLGNIQGRYGTCNSANCLCVDASCGGSDNISYLIKQGVNNIFNYCNDVYKKYAKNKEEYKDRLNECLTFRNFYVEMADNGIIDSAESCGLLSPDLTVKIKWVLNIFRIVAPIIAIGLGTVDFIKVIASGDADKEMKNAGKRLLYRLIAAVLLLIIPTIIAFLMDVFLGNSDGYDPDNPFCNIVEWKE